jgi:hypothetical protein
MADNKNKKLISLATNKKNVVKNPETLDTTKKTSVEEDRNIKAKQTVKKLLEGTSLLPKDKEKTIETIPQVKKEGLEWLQDQLALLSSENENLRNELVVAKEDYGKIFEQIQKIKGGNSNEYLDATINQNIILLFTDLQNNLLGNNAQGVRWEFTYIKPLLNKMLLMFPFTANIKKF